MESNLPVLFRNMLLSAALSFWLQGKAEENFKEQLESNFNFTALKEMIDK